MCVWLVGFLVCFLVGFFIYKLLLPYQKQVRVFKQATVVPSKTPGRQGDAALEFHLFLWHFALGVPGSISSATLATGNAALRRTVHSAWHSKQLHPWLRRARSIGITTQGAPHRSTQTL